MVKPLLDEAGAREVENAVREVEKHTSTELVVAVLAKSGDYFTWRAVVSVGAALGGTIALYFLTHWLPVFWLIVLQPMLAVLVFAVTGWEPLYRTMISPETADRNVTQRAFALFAERGVHRTRDRTGLLIFVSTLEHEVVILGDSGLHERVGDEGWSAQVSFLVTRIREGQAKQGLIEVIRHFEPILAELAPRRADDVNELPDAVVRR
jgi:putative membrane protein